MLRCHSKRVSVAAAVSGHRRLEHHRTAADIDDPDRVLVAVRVDTDHEVQLICKHLIDLQPWLGDNSGSRSGE
jgi:hypothetical protein